MNQIGISFIYNSDKGFTLPISKKNPVEIPLSKMKYSKALNHRAKPTTPKLKVNNIKNHPSDVCSELNAIEMKRNSSMSNFIENNSDVQEFYTTIKCQRQFIWNSITP